VFGRTSNNWHNTGLYGWKGLKIPAPLDLIVENRDFFNYPKPGYQPYVYPHPLASVAPVLAAKTGNLGK
jgi:hypothetical protein